MKSNELGFFILISILLSALFLFKGCESGVYNPSNDPPEITDVKAEPDTLFPDQPTQLIVCARDINNDELKIHWFVNGAMLEDTTYIVIWTAPDTGIYNATVEVTDPIYDTTVTGSIEIICMTGTIDLVPNNPQIIENDSSINFDCNAHYSDGSSQNVDNQAIWNCTALGSINNSGVFTASSDTIGTGYVSATLIGLSDTTAVEVIDIINPVITITQPSDGYTLDTTDVKIEGTASDNVGIDSVQVQINSGDWWIAEGEEEWSLDVILLSNQQNEIIARGFDTSGNEASDTVSVWVP